MEIDRVITMVEIDGVIIVMEIDGVITIMEIIGAKQDIKPLNEKKDDLFEGEDTPKKEILENKVHEEKEEAFNPCLEIVVTNKRVGEVEQPLEKLKEWEKNDTIHIIDMSKNYYTNMFTHYNHKKEMCLEFGVQEDGLIKHEGGVGTSIYEKEQ
ncbi:hypothetical protein CR513_60987, partial [Mucuna pruriens]